MINFSVRQLSILLLLMIFSLSACSIIDFGDKGSPTLTPDGFAEHDSSNSKCPVSKPEWVKPPEDSAVEGSSAYGHYFVNNDHSIWAAAWWTGEEESYLRATEEGIKVGLFRPITLLPFPKQQVSEISKRVKRILVVEMNSGMMLEDIKAQVQGRIPVEFYGRMGGMTPFPDEILDEIRRVAGNDEDVENKEREQWLQRLEARIEGEK